MIKPFKNELPLGRLVLLLPLLGILFACNPTEITGNGVQSNVIVNDGSYDGMAYIYPDSPYILGGPNYSATNPNMGIFTDRQPKLVTVNNKLTANCTVLFNFSSSTSTIEDCIKSLKDKTSDQQVTRKSDGTYIFPANSSEFYQANTLYHLTQATNSFLTKIGEAYDIIRYGVDTRYPKSLPSYLKDSKLYWFKALTDNQNKFFQSDVLTSYSECDLQNAEFSPIGPTLCFGKYSLVPGFLFVQDPSIIYHELGHAFVSIMMNMRNGTSTEYHALRSNLGTSGYNEAASINEGIADYFSYIMNKREVIGEFALGKTVNQSRPLSEASSMHIDGIDETSEGRLSYPQYLHYDPNEPDKINEGVHYAGQIMGHYLVALTKAFKTQCGIASEADGGHGTATTYMTLLLAETLSELGDLNARGIDFRNGSSLPLAYTVYFNNMDSTNSYLWSQVLNQVTYRRFFQTFGKNINKYITNNLCSNFNKNESEKLMDDYGLLLFKTYNDNGNSTKSRSITYTTIDPLYAFKTPAVATAVAEDNRRKSVLASKQLIDLAAKTAQFPNRAPFYVIDESSKMQNLLKDLLFKGYVVPLSQNVAGTVYNNHNLRLSPGEVVALVPNLVNNSNSAMGGVQLLATDWDHVHITDTGNGNFKPCVIDTTTTVDQGGEAGNTCTTTDTTYQRLLWNPTTERFPASAAAPVCLVQMEDGNVSRWVSQNEFRKKQGLSLLDKDCLGFSTSGTSNTDFTMNPHECLVRFLPGANDAFYSKIDAQKTFQETVHPESKEITFKANNSLIMEINKWIPPGTKFRCRLRARFTNCSDCYTDGTNANDDYLDYELNGSKPFKVINFDFEVND